MSLIHAAETLNSQIPFGQIGNVISSPKVFQKKSLKQIADTEISLCNISLSDFANVFSFEIVNIIGDEFSEQIIFKLEYADKFFVHLKLNGYWELSEEPQFQLTDVGWVFEEKENNPTSAFLIETFKVILCLSDKVKVKMPVINYNFECTIPLSLNGISEILQNRQIAYRLMVIEKALDISLPLPRRMLESEEVGSIAFCYHAIVDRKFEWFCPPAIVSWLASQTYYSLLPEKNVPFPIQYENEPIEKEIFGCRIDLGSFSGKIEDAILDNFEEVKKELAKLDGSEVLAQIRSKSGFIQIESITTPHLPKKAFSKDIQQLIDLEDKFDSMYFDKYLNSFSNAFEGLTDEQFQAITERPTLEEEAFNF